MQTISGLGKTERERLAALIRGTKGTIAVPEAASILKVSPSDASKMLSKWASKGWLSRVRQGFYVPVPIESRTTDVPLEDPWVIADRLYSPCYIGGWSAAEYWGLTEQIFRTVVVMTTQKPRDRRPVIKGTGFLLRTVSAKTLFGLKPAWRGQVKMSVSDPTRTILDMLSDPQLGGGIHPTSDMFKNYLKSKNKNMDLLIEYADRLGNGAVFKRLGFFLEQFAKDEQSIIDRFKTKLTKGNARLDPKITAGKLITRWKLWVPRSSIIKGKIRA